MQRKWLSKFGFTLIEMLISMALIAILVIAINDFLFNYATKLTTEIIKTNVDSQATLALQILGKDITNSAHVLDAGTAANSSSTNIKAWINLSPWVTGADLQIWHLVANSDWFVLNSPKPLSSSYKNFANLGNTEYLKMRLNGNSSSKSNLACTNFNPNAKNLFNADYSDIVRLTDDYYAYNQPINSNMYDAIDSEKLEKFLLENYSLLFGTWLDKHSKRVYPSNWRETHNLLLDKNATILPKHKGCIEILDAPARLITINNKDILDITAKISKNPLGVYRYEYESGKYRQIIVNSTMKNFINNDKYFNKNHELLVQKNKTWRRLDANANLVTKNTVKDLPYFKHASQFIGVVKNSTNTQMHAIIQTQTYSPLLRARNLTQPNKYYYFYAQSKTAKSYAELIKTTCSNANWETAEVQNYQNCANTSANRDFYLQNCKPTNYANLPKVTPIYAAKIPQLNFSCSKGFTPELDTQGKKIYINAKPKIKYFRVATDSQFSHDGKNLSMFYYRLSSANNDKSTMLNKVNSINGTLNYFANNSKIDAHSNLHGCDIKRIRATKHNSSVNQAYLPTFKAEVILRPQDFIATTNSAWDYKYIYNCVNNRLVQTNYSSPYANATRGESEWRFKLTPENYSFNMNLKFEPHLWYVQDTPKLHRDNHKSLIYSVAKCNANRQCHFDNKYIRNQLNGLVNMQVRFLNPLTGKWLNIKAMQAWLNANNQNWDKIKALKIGILVCDTDRILPQAQTKIYKVLDTKVENNSIYCTSNSGSFYLNNPGLRLQ